MLSWVGKRPLREVRTYPAQLVERFAVDGETEIDDWRAMVDSVMIDTSYDGQTFEITLADIPERKADLVDGTYGFDVPPDSTAVAVRITDMLGEDVLVELPTAQAD